MFKLFLVLKLSPSVFWLYPGDNINGGTDIADDSGDI